jgi:putative lipoprotein
MLEVGLSSAHTLIENRNLLKRLGFIDFKQGKKGQPTLYRLNDMCEEKGALNALNTAPQTALETASNSALNTAPQTAHIYRQETMTKTKKEKCKKEKAAAFSFCGYTQNAELIEALRGFVEMRKKVKAPLTEHALSLLLRKLDGLGRSDAEKVEIVNQSVMNNWKGFFALKQEVKQNGAGRDNSRAAIEARYQDFVEADKKHVYPWDIRAKPEGDSTTSG